MANPESQRQQVSSRSWLISLKVSPLSKPLLVGLHSFPTVHPHNCNHFLSFSAQRRALYERLKEGYDPRDSKYQEWASAQ